MSALTDTAQRFTSFFPIPAEASEEFDSGNYPFLKQQKQSFFPSSVCFWVCWGRTVLSLSCVGGGGDLLAVPSFELGLEFFVSLLK